MQNIVAEAIYRQHLQGKYDVILLLAAVFEILGIAILGPLNDEVKWLVVNLHENISHEK